MTYRVKDDGELVEAKIRAAFADSTFAGPITAVDEMTNEELDEEQALYGALRGRSWSEISASLIARYPDGIALLTDEAFIAFLPAWLTRALKDDEVLEAMVYMFSPHARTSEMLNRRLRLLSAEQREALEAFLAHCVDVESSKFVKDHARRAVAHVATFKSN